jgi:hypothetical protein
MEEGVSVVDLYLAKRRALLEARVPLDGWTVHVSAADAEQITERIVASVDGRAMGARWTTDSALTAGELRIEREGRLLL